MHLFELCYTKRKLSKEAKQAKLMKGGLDAGASVSLTCTSLMMMSLGEPR